MTDDEPVARAIAAAVPGAQLLFLYASAEHYLAEHDKRAAALMRERVPSLLAAVGDGR